MGLTILVGFFQRQGDFSNFRIEKNAAVLCRYLA